MRKIVINISLITLSIFILFAALETIFRIIPFSFLEKHQSLQIINDSDPLLISTHTGMRLRKNTTVEIEKRDGIGTFDIKTNSLGYRSEELGAKNKEDKRILVLGDSITLGAFLPVSQTYPFYIKEYLDISNVINAGVDGADLLNEYFILQETGLLTEPDIVIVGLYLNDAVKSPVVNRIKYPSMLQHSHFFQFLADRILILKKHYTYNVSNYKIKKNSKIKKKTKKQFIAKNKPNYKPSAWKTDQASFNTLLIDQFEDTGFAWTKEYWAILEKTVILFKQAAKENDFELIFVLFPTRYQVQSEMNRNEPQQFFSDLMKKMEIKHLDVLPYLRAKYEKDALNLYFDQCHMTAAGNKFVGSIIAEFLKEHSEVLESIH